MDICFISKARLSNARLCWEENGAWGKVFGGKQIYLSSPYIFSSIHYTRHLTWRRIAHMEIRCFQNWLVIEFRSQWQSLFVYMQWTGNNRVVSRSPACHDAGIADAWTNPSGFQYIYRNIWFITDIMFSFCMCSAQTYNISYGWVWPNGELRGNDLKNASVELNLYVHCWILYLNVGYRLKWYTTMKYIHNQMTMNHWGTRKKIVWTYLFDRKCNHCIVRRWWRSVRLFGVMPSVRWMLFIRDGKLADYRTCDAYKIVICQNCIERFINYNCYHANSQLGLAHLKAFLKFKIWHKNYLWRNYVPILHSFSIQLECFHSNLHQCTGNFRPGLVRDWTQTDYFYMPGRLIRNPYFCDCDSAC